MYFKRSAVALLGLALVAGVAACSRGGEAALADAPKVTGALERQDNTVTPTAAATTAAPPPPTTTISPYLKPGWITEENKKPGTDEWRIDPDKMPKNASIEGYFNTTSAEPGDTVDLAVSTNAATWTVTGYRMGYYGGARGRVVMQSAAQPGVKQPAATVDRNTGLAEARWPSSLKIAITKEFPPGDYLFKLVAENGAQILVPLTIRDDESKAGVVVVNAVTTWQAYNDWGACSFYKCLFLSGRSRTSIVSFDRPILFAYNQGTADFIDHELALVSLVEELGLDVTYVTDMDLHQRPDVLLQRKVVISLGHDEYYSRPMYDALEKARDAGVNLMFLGANAVYRGIRFEPGPTGVVDQRMINYRSTADPITKTDPSLSTVEWRVAPLNRPENALIGVMYECAGVVAPMRITNASNWVFEGTGAKNGQTLQSVIGNEYDKVYPGKSSPPTLEVLAHSPLTCRDRASAADMTYYTAPSGAGVFASGTIRWICSIDAMCTSADSAKIVRGVTVNVLNAFSEGPAAEKHPAKPSAVQATPVAPAPTTKPATTAPATSPATSAPASTVATTAAPPTSAAPVTTAKPPASTVIAPTTVKVPGVTKAP